MKRWQKYSLGALGLAIAGYYGTSMWQLHKENAEYRQNAVQMADFTKDGRIGCVEAIRPYHELKLTGREILDHLDTEAVARVVGYFRENEPEEFLIAVGREVLESGRYPTNRDVVRRAASRNPQIDISQVGAIAVFCIGYDGRSIEGENFLRSRKTNPTLEDRLISFVYPPAANDSSELERYAMETSEH